MPASQRVCTKCVKAEKTKTRLTIFGPGFLFSDWFSPMITNKKLLNTTRHNLRPHDLQAPEPHRARETHAVARGDRQAGPQDARRTAPMAERAAAVQIGPRRDRFRLVREAPPVQEGVRGARRRDRDGALLRESGRFRPAREVDAAQRHYGSQVRQVGERAGVDIPRDGRRERVERAHVEAEGVLGIISPAQGRRRDEAAHAHRRTRHDARGARQGQIKRVRPQEAGRLDGRVAYDDPGARVRRRPGEEPALAHGGARLFHRLLHGARVRRGVDGVVRALDVVRRRRVV